MQTCSSSVGLTVAEAAEVESIMSPRSAAASMLAFCSSSFSSKNPKFKIALINGHLFESCATVLC